MNESQEIGIDLQSYPNGIMLVWSRYDIENSEPFDYQWNHSVVSKLNIGSTNFNSGHCFVLFNQYLNKNLTGIKYLYINNTRILGNVNNNKINSVGCDNRNWVLRQVIAF